MGGKKKTRAKKTSQKRSRQNIQAERLEALLAQFGISKAEEEPRNVADVMEHLIAVRSTLWAYRRMIGRCIELLNALHKQGMSKELSWEVPFQLAALVDDLPPEARELFDEELESRDVD